MKRSIRVLALLLAIVLLGVSLAACSKTEEKEEDSGITGTYTGSYTYNGSSFDVSIKLKKDGTYTDTTKQNGTVVAVQEGEYEVKGNSVFLYIPTDSEPRSYWTEYAYKDGSLTNNGYTFTKK